MSLTREQLLASARGQSLLSSINQTEESKKLEIVGDRIQQEYRIWEDELRDATRLVEDTEREFIRTEEDRNKAIILLEETKKEVDNGKFGVDFKAAEKFYFSYNTTKENVDSKIFSQGLSYNKAKLNYEEAKIKLSIRKEYGIKSGWLVE